MGDHAENRHRDDVETGPQGTRVFRRQEIERYFADHDMESNISAGAPSGASLTGVRGDFKDRRFDVPMGRSTVGRSSTNNIVVDSDTVSLVHARILQKDDEWWILNLLSTNGTYVNDRKITDSQLQDGDRIHFGEAEFVFHIPQRQTRRGLGWLFKLARKLASLLS